MPWGLRKREMRRVSDPGLQFEVEKTKVNAIDYVIKAAVRGFAYAYEAGLMGMASFVGGLLDDVRESVCVRKKQQECRCIALSHFGRWDGSRMTGTTNDTAISHGVVYIMMGIGVCNLVVQG